MLAKSIGEAAMTRRIRQNIKKKKKKKEKKFASSRRTWGLLLRGFAICIFHIYPLKELQVPWLLL